MEEGEKRTEVQKAVARHWANKFTDPIVKKDDEDIVELDSTSDESEELEIIEERTLKKPRNGDGKNGSRPDALTGLDEATAVVSEKILSAPVFNSSRLHTSSPVHMLDTPVLRPPASDSILSFFRSKLLKETFVFSFELDVEFITSEMHNWHDTKINIIGQNLYNTRNTNNMRYTKVKDLITPWSVHHSKMAINFYKDDTMQVFITTSNFTPDEYAVLGGVYWKSDLLLPITAGSIKATKQDFKIDLCNYLREYKKPEIDQLIEQIKVYDFSGVKATFIGSAPGLSSGEFGYLRLQKELINKKLIPDLNSASHKKFKFLAQVSTIAGPFKSKKEEVSNIFTHVLVPMVLGKTELPLPNGEDGLQGLKGTNYEIEPVILFPTVKEIFGSRAGTRGCGCLIYNNVSKKGADQDSYLSRYFYKRNPGEIGSFVNNHSKIYILSEDNFETLNWCFVGSMNLSKSAWGSPATGGALRGSNWECGVLLDPKDFNEKGKFVPTFNSNQFAGEYTPIRLPFKLPVEKYGQDDKVWSKFDPIWQS